MGQITIRGLDHKIERQIRQLARKEEKSLNKVILDLIYTQTGHRVHKPKPKAHTLKKLAGSWTQKQADEVLAAVKIFEQIDENMWL